MHVQRNIVKSFYQWMLKHETSRHSFAPWHFYCSPKSGKITYILKEGAVALHYIFSIFENGSVIALSVKRTPN